MSDIKEKGVKSVQAASSEGNPPEREDWFQDLGLGTWDVYTLEF